VALGSIATANADEFVRLLEPGLADAYRLAGYLLRDSGEAQDAIQEALAKAWLGWPNLRDRGRVEAWFDRIVANECIDRLRGRGRVSLIELDEAIADRRTAPDPFRNALARDEVGRLVATLPPDQQLLVALRFWRDMSLEQVAERLQLPLGTVKSRLHYALQALRRELDRQGGEVHR